MINDCSFQQHARPTPHGMLHLRLCWSCQPTNKSSDLPTSFIWDLGQLYVIILQLWSPYQEDFPLVVVQGGEVDTAAAGRSSQKGRCVATMHIVLYVGLILVNLWGPDLFPRHCVLISELNLFTTLAHRHCMSYLEAREHYSSVLLENSWNLKTVQMKLVVQTPKISNGKWFGKFGGFRGQQRGRSRRTEVTEVFETFRLWS